MRAFVLLRDPSGQVHELEPGDLIGRLSTAALPLDDEHVSEAHALVSLRRGELVLLSLRALFAVQGKPVRELVLRPGQTIEVTRSLALQVEDVVVPPWVLGLSVPGLAPQPLPSPAWLVLRPTPRLVSRPSEAAVASFWSVGDAWRVRVGDGAASPLEVGWQATLDGVPARAVRFALGPEAGDPTRAGGVEAPLVLVCHHDTVVIEPQGAAALTLAGQLARLICELAEIGQLVEWEAVARRLWQDDDTLALRRRWDTALARLRRKLRVARVRTDLVQSDGAGRVLLQLRAGDTLQIEG